MLVSFACSAYNSTEKEAECSSETSVNFKTSRFHLTEDGTDSGKNLVQITVGGNFYSLKQNWKIVNTKETVSSCLIYRNNII
jgi:hypothetical protein